MEKKFLVGSSYFFKGQYGFRPHDVDYVILCDELENENITEHTWGNGECVIKWKRMPKEELIGYTIKSSLPMEIGKFLVPEFCNEIGFTIEDLKKLRPVIDRIDDRHSYEKIIYDSYIENNDFVLTTKQKRIAFIEYYEKRRNK